MANGPLANQSHLRTRRHRFPGKRHLARLRCLQTDRRHHLHRLQGLRSGVPGMERLSLPRDRFRQHLPDHAGSGVELLQSDPLQRSHVDDNGNFSWLMRKDQCMHCADPGCLRACPADGAIVQYTNGIVDFQQENCIGCQYCVTGCPFNIPKFNRRPRKSTSARCVRIAWARDWSRPASKPVPPAACISAPRTT